MTFDFSTLNPKTFDQVLMENCERVFTVAKLLLRAAEAALDDNDMSKEEKTKKVKAYEHEVKKACFYDDLMKLIEAKTYMCDIDDEKIEFLRWLTQNQKHVSESRLVDFNEGGCMYRGFKSRLDNEHFSEFIDEMQNLEHSYICLCEQIEELLNDIK